MTAHVAQRAPTNKSGPGDLLGWARYGLSQTYYCPSTDRDRVIQFAKTHGLTFPVLYDDGVAKLYNVDSYPANIFIDRLGNIRYSQAGAFDESGRRLETIISELLK